MPEINFINVISCSNDDENYPADNLLCPRLLKKWKCKPGEKQASIILQLEKAVRIRSFDVGNEGSAFVEILGGRTSTKEDDFHVLLPTSAFMTPDESRKETNLNGVKSFDVEKLVKENRDEKWDRLKINCTQPFNKNLAFGLSFVKVHANVDAEKAIGRFKLKDDVDEFGASKSADLSPGALFLAKRKATTSDGGSGSTTQPIEKFERRHESQSKRAKNGKENGVKTSARKDIHLDTKKEASKNSPTLEKAGSLKKVSTSGFKKCNPLDLDKDKKPNSLSQGSTKRKEPTGVPFDKLFENVTFVLSGFQNPERGELRDQALEMGAKYQADWCPGCTHLICAFPNTPKFHQVRGKGKIVKKAWIVDSHKNRRRMPWKKYSFEEVDDKESDEEMIAQSSSEDSSSSSSRPAINGDKRKGTDNSSDAMNKAIDDDDVYDASTDYSDMESDCDNGARLIRKGSGTASTSTKPRPSPDFFTGLHFFLYGGFPNMERKKLERLIASFNGVVGQYMTKKVTYVLTRERWDESFDEALREFPRVIFLDPNFVLDCGRSEKLVDIDRYIINNTG